MDFKDGIEKPQVGGVEYKVIYHSSKGVTHQQIRMLMRAMNGTRALGRLSLPDTEFPLIEFDGGLCVFWEGWEYPLAYLKFMPSPPQTTVNGQPWDLLRKLEERSLPLEFLAEKFLMRCDSTWNAARFAQEGIKIEVVELV